MASSRLMFFVGGWLLLVARPSVLFAQDGKVQGKVTLESSGEPMHNVRVVLSPLGKSTHSEENGTYSIPNVPPGSYDVLVSIQGLSDQRQRVRVTANNPVATVDFSLRIAAVREQITVTASGREEGALDSVQTVASMDATELTQRAASSLGEVLDKEVGVSKRSFGPGTSRPVIRGFDGDRVLILQDGVRTGTLSSQSGDHGEPMDVNTLERLEIVRGPATLLYGSNAVGGVVNAISRHDLLDQDPHAGVRGFVTGQAGTANAFAGASGGLDIGLGAWYLYGNGGGQRTGDYHTPIGVVDNSNTRNGSFAGGAGRYTNKSFFSGGYLFNDAKYAVPYDPEEEDPEIVSLKMRRHGVRFNGGLKNLDGFADRWQLTGNYSDYKHQEIAAGEIGTEFFNKQFIYRTVIDQKKRGRFVGSFGAWGLHRDYKTVGEESLSPPTKQDAFALFAVESLDFEKTRIQFGGRFERNSFDAQGLQGRTFNGLSGAIGISHRLGSNTALVANYTHSYRAPAIEELYNNGPHPGNLTFEIGNPNLKRERNDGFDFGARHHASRFRGDVNFFVYRLTDFVYLAPTGEIEDGLPAADYAQANALYRGAEAKADFALTKDIWLITAVDGVRAELRDSGMGLPRIPPIRGRIGVDGRWRGFQIRPEMILASKQSNVFENEAPTAGYGVFNLTGGFTRATSHAMHQISGTFFNAGDRLYRNHLSFIKEFAPEIGRGFRISYTMRFF